MIYPESIFCAQHMRVIERDYYHQFYLAVYSVPHFANFSPYCYAPSIFFNFVYMLPTLFASIVSMYTTVWYQAIIKDGWDVYTIYLIYKYFVVTIHELGLLWDTILHDWSCNVF